VFEVVEMEISMLQKVLTQQLGLALRVDLMMFLAVQMIQRVTLTQMLH
jgi:hypothetical protein